MSVDEDFNALLTQNQDLRSEVQALQERAEKAEARVVELEAEVWAWESGSPC